MSWQTETLHSPFTRESTLRDRFLQLDGNGSPSLLELQALQEAIDAECLRRSQKVTSVTQWHGQSSDTSVRLAVYLSKSLLQCGDPSSGIFREIQLRTLVAALALLHHNEVTTLNPEPYDALKKNISARFADIVDSRTKSQETFAGRLHRATSLYLIRLASQYFSLFKRSQPLADALPIPILGLILAGASIASGQYNSLQAAFKYADDLIGLVPGRASQHLSLPGLQELTRNAITIERRKDIIAREGENHTEDKADIEADGKVVFEVTKLLQELLTTHIASTPPSSDAYWRDWPMVRLRRGPPLLNRWYFFHGLLDCAVQLAHFVSPDQIPEKLQSVLAQLMVDTGFEGFRWKTIEFFLARDETRAQQYDILVYSAQSCDEPARTQLLSEIEGVRDDLEGRNPQNVASKTKPLPPASSRIFTECFRRSASSNSASMIAGNPDSSPRYLEGELRPWQTHGNAVIMQIPLKKGFHNKSFSLAGLSSDCSSVFFCNPTEIYVHSLEHDLRKPPDDTLILHEKFKMAFSIGTVALSKSFALISNRMDLMLLGLWNGQWNRQKKNEELLKWPHGDWDSTGVAIHEDDSRVTILVAQRRQSSTDGLEGRILSYEISLTTGLPLQKGRPIIYGTPSHDFPKVMSLDMEARTLACITGIRNTVLVWAVDGGRSATQAPFAIMGNRYKPETDSDGVTSASMYTAPTANLYVLCTTAASTERWHNEGEWPFCSPVIMPPGSVPESSVHNLVQLQQQRTLIAGTASNRAGVFAVLEKTGKIFLVGLTGHENGGICGQMEPPKLLSASLSAQSGVAVQATSRLRFDPSGSKLYAVDPKGKVIIVSFQAEKAVFSQSHELDVF